MTDFKWYGGTLTRLLGMAADEALTETAAEITRDAIADAPVFIGNLRRTIAFSKPHDEGQFRVVDIGVKGGKKETFRYAMAVERGRKPGKQPPVEALMLWVKRKWGLKVRALGSDLTQSGNKTGRAFRQIKRGRRLENDIKGAAFVLARHIGKHGTKPRPFLMPAWDRHIRKLGERVKRRFDAIKSMNLTD